jgi:hypothetical protein
MRAAASFQIGEAFPANDPIARFVTVLAMVNNEWHRSMALMNLVDDDPDGRGIRLLLVRQQAASYLEAVKWITDSRKRFPEIAAYIDGLSADAQTSYDRLMEGIDPESPDYMDWLAGHRNVTSHFPKLHPDAFANGDEEIANALTQAAEITGTVTVERPTEAAVRFGWADEVAVQLLPDIEASPDEIEKLSGARIALMRFGVEAIGTYLMRSDAERQQSQDARS